MTRAAVIALMCILLAACGGERSTARVRKPVGPQPPAPAEAGAMTPELAELLRQGPGGPAEGDLGIDLEGDRPIALRIVLPPQDL